MISRTNIVDLISQRISLKKQGKNFLACCPFHAEKNPSFTVNTEKQFYYCFSCGSHGNVIDFLMNYDRLTFIETIKELSMMHDFSIKRDSNIYKDNNYNKNNLYQLMNKLCTYYKDILKQKKYLYVYKYLQNRGLNEKSISDFNIGFAPSKWNNIIQKFNLTPYDQTLLDQSGMLISSNTKYKHDRFRNRLMFPIRDTIGRIIAFGGRVIEYNKTPKYLNSPDTEIFKKSQHLYGLYEARTQCKNLSCILLVEGYIDVISLTQFGINYSVASLGTSITDNHIRLMYNITDQIVCCFDGDYAGKQAAWRTLNTALPYLTDNRHIYFVFLPSGEDPDTLIRKIGKDRFLKKLTKKQDLSNFLFETLSKKINLQTLAGRVKLSSLILPMIHKIPGPTLKLCLLQQLGNKIGILDDNKLNQLLKKKTIASTTNKIQKNYINYSITHVLIGLLIQYPKLSKLIPNIQGLEQCKQDNIVIFIDLVQTCKKYPTLTAAQLLEHYRENKFFSKLETLAYWNHLITNDMIETTFIDALTKLYNLTLEQRQEKLIARDRIFGLTKQERQELWLLNQKLSKY